MSDWLTNAAPLAWTALGAVSAAVVFRVIKEIAQNGISSAPFIHVDAIDRCYSVVPNQKARDLLLGNRHPTLEELQAYYPGENDPENYRFLK